jgi:hypothetical protein
MGQLKVNWFGIIIGSLVGAAAISNLASAADLNSESLLRAHRVHRMVVAPTGCGFRCHGGCPQRYTCYSLYGAYAPFGGTAYWARYTISGWSHYR